MVLDFRLSCISDYRLSCIDDVRSILLSREISPSLYIVLMAISML